MRQERNVLAWSKGISPGTLEGRSIRSGRLTGCVSRKSMSSSPEWFLRLRGLASLFVAMALIAGSAPGQPTQAQIDAARDRGVQALRNIKDGSPGYRALVTMTLVKLGEPADSPTVKPVLDAIAARVDSAGIYRPAALGNNEEIYEAGVSAMALCNADPELYRPQIHAIAQFIMSKQIPDGGWDYASARSGDTSVTQYGALGLWDASRTGVRVPLRVWDRLANWHLKTQLRDGGFAYKPGSVNDNSGPTNAMTTAAVGSLYVARLHLYPAAAGLTPDDVRPAPASGEGFAMVFSIRSTRAKRRRSSARPEVPRSRMW
jgi:hypothetical protein